MGTGKEVIMIGWRSRASGGDGGRQHAGGCKYCDEREGWQESGSGAGSGEGGDEEKMGKRAACKCKTLWSAEPWARTAEEKGVVLVGGVELSILNNDGVISRKAGGGVESLGHDGGDKGVLELKGGTGVVENGGVSTYRDGYSAIGEVRGRRVCGVEGGEIGRGKDVLMGRGGVDEGRDGGIGGIFGICRRNNRQSHRGRPRVNAGGDDHSSGHLRWHWIP